MLYIETATASACSRIPQEPALQGKAEKRRIDSAVTGGANEESRPLMPVVHKVSLFLDKNDIQVKQQVSFFLQLVIHNQL